MSFVCLPGAMPVQRYAKPALLFAVALALFPASVMSACAGDSPEHLYVTLDKAKLLKLPEHVETIVVGNPTIADITMIRKNGLMVVTGKGFGETNVIFLDGTGQAISEALVTVRTAPYLLTVQRGMDRESYSCAPRCEPAVTLGDATKFLQDASGQITARNTLVTPSGGH